MKTESPTIIESLRPVPALVDDGATSLRITDDQTEIVGTFIPHPMYTQDDAMQQVFGTDGQISDIADAHARAVLKPAEEKSLFLQYNYSRFRVAQAITARRNAAASARLDQEIRMWHRAALARRDRLVESNLGLVAMMIRNCRTEGADYDELLSEGNLTLLHAVDKFDINRGFRFSTYACQAIHHAIIQAMARRQRRYWSSLSDSESADLAVHSEVADPLFEEALRVRDVLLRNDAMLTDMELQVVRSRFALPRALTVSHSEEPMTRKAIGKMLGVSKERIRQIETNALGKLRDVLQNIDGWESLTA